MLLKIFKVISKNKSHTNKYKKKKHEISNNNALLDSLINIFIDSQKNQQNPCKTPIMANPLLSCRRKKKNNRKTFTNK